MREDIQFEKKQNPGEGLRVTIHRGSDQIGGNCIEISCGGTTILLDLGKPLQDEDAGLPDTLRRFDAVLLSHAHEDHWGLIDLLPPESPVYSGELCWNLIRTSRLFRKIETPEKKINFFRAWHAFRIGELTVTPFLMDHSSPDAYAFLIEGEGARVFYSGDFRAHGRKAKLFHHLVNNPPPDIDLLLLEGTTIGREEQLYPSEEAVQLEFEHLLRDNLGPAFLVASGQNLDRLVTAYKAARRAGRELVLDIYTAWVLREISSRFVNVPDLCWPGIRVLARGSTAASHYRVLLRYPELFGRFTRELYESCNTVTEDELALHPGRYLVKTNRVASLLDRLKPIERTLVIYSMWEGYLAPAYDRNGRNDLRELQERPDLDFRIVHTSGHASVGDLNTLAKSMAPGVLAPVHTEHPDEFREIYSHVRLLKDGEVMQLESNRS